MKTRSVTFDAAKQGRTRLLTCPHVSLAARAEFFETSNGQPCVRYEQLPPAGIIYISKRTIIVRCDGCDPGNMIVAGILRDLS